MRVAFAYAPEGPSQWETLEEARKAISLLAERADIVLTREFALPDSPELVPLLDLFAGIPLAPGKLIVANGRVATPDGGIGGVNVVSGYFSGGVSEGRRTTFFPKRGNAGVVPEDEDRKKRNFRLINPGTGEFSNSNGKILGELPPGWESYSNPGHSPDGTYLIDADGFGSVWLPICADQELPPEKCDVAALSAYGIGLRQLRKTRAGIYLCADTKYFQLGIGKEKKFFEFSQARGGIAEGDWSPAFEGVIMTKGKMNMLPHGDWKPGAGFGEFGKVERAGNYLAIAELF